MGLRAAFVRMLSRGAEDPVDPDELVELVTVPHFEGQLVVAEMRVNGIDAIATDELNMVTRTATDSRISVRRADLDAAHAVLQDRFSHEVETDS